MDSSGIELMPVCQYVDKQKKEANFVSKINLATFYLSSAIEEMEEALKKGKP
jgi:hypothetical protein